MLVFPIRWRPVAAIVLAGSLACALSPNAYAQKKPKITKAKPQKDSSPSVEPDKVLYNRAMDDIKRGHFIESRLNLQTLVNTYPDSEYLAKAKLAVADSYFKEGGTSNLTQAVDEYKNFIVFFPFLDEAAYAQMQVALAHYHMMEKPDRDTSQGLAAESELQIFLQKYPQSPLHAKAEQYLREVQEILADGEFRIGRFYYVRARTNPIDYSAAAARLMEVSERYPLYSESDEALWMLGDIYERVKTLSKNEDDKNHWADLSAKCYKRIVTEYPDSKFAPMAKARLQGMGLPVPPADPAALARMEKDRAYQRSHRHNNPVIAGVRSNPGVTYAARSGEPTLNAPDDAVSATEVLKQGAQGPLFGAEAQRAAEAENERNAPSGPTNVIEGASIDASTSPGGGNSVGAQIIEAPSGAPGDTGTASAPPAPSSSSPDSTGAADLPTGVISNSTTDSSAAQSTAPQSTAPAAQDAQGIASTPAGTTGSSSSSSSSPPAAQSSTSTSQGDKESTSKKKKGLHKLIPF